MGSMDPDKEQQGQEYRQLVRNFRLAGLAALVMIAGGMVFYRIVEGFNWVDGFYFCVVTLATVGYGDIVPHTDLGKIFTSFYILGGIGVIAAFANVAIKSAVARRRYKHGGPK